MEADRGQAMGCEDCDKELNFILSENWKVLSREHIFKDYSSCCKKIILDVLGWRQGRKQGYQLVSLFS